VCGIQVIRDLDRQIEGFVRTQTLTFYAMLERLAVQDLHRDEAPAFVLVDVVNGADIGMLSAYAAWASCWNLSSACRSLDTSSVRNFSATARLSLVSSAL